MRCRNCYDSMCSECPGDSAYCISCYEEHGAETFDVEFDDWAEQEMLTHGRNVSFKDWAKREGKTHGNMELTDWAEHEEESHDERYGAEEYEAFYLIDVGKREGDKLIWEGIPLGHKAHDKTLAIEEYNEMKSKHDAIRLAEVKNYYEDITSSHGVEGKVLKEQTHTFIMNHNNAGNFDVRGNLLEAEEYEITISDNNMDFGVSHKSFNDEKEALEEAWELSQKETDKFVYVRGNDGKVIRVFRPNLGRGAETFESPATQDKIKPRTIATLLGAGALATILAPETIKKLFNRK